MPLVPVLGLGLVLVVVQGLHPPHMRSNPRTRLLVARQTTTDTERGRTLHNLPAQEDTTRAVVTPIIMVMATATAQATITSTRATLLRLCRSRIISLIISRILRPSYRTRRLWASVSRYALS